MGCKAQHSPNPNPPRGIRNGCWDQVNVFTQQNGPIQLNQIDLVHTIKLGSTMHTVNIHEAKTHLSRLVERAAKGEPFVIAKAGHPMVKVVALSQHEAQRPRRVGFMAGAIKVPPDFDSMGREQIEHMFLGNDAT